MDSPWQRRRQVNPLPRAGLNVHAGLLQSAEECVERLAVSRGQHAGADGIGECAERRQIGGRSHRDARAGKDDESSFTLSCDQRLRKVNFLIDPH
jgi:hypothetical protein